MEINISRDDEQWIKQLVEQQTGIMHATGREAMRAIVAKDLAVQLIALHCGCDCDPPETPVLAECHHDPEACVKKALELAALIVPDS